MSSVSPSKKRKHREVDAADDAARKAKRARRHRDKLEKKRSGRDSSEFARIDASLVAAVPPSFATNLPQGVLEMLDSMLMRYIPPLRGVVLAHSNLRFLDSKAEIRDDSPFAICRVAFTATVWSPGVGQRLTGRITLSSPDHVALLVHRTFNAAIPASHLPRDEWEFVASMELEDTNIEEGEEGDAVTPASDPRTTGHWIHKHTGEPLGGQARTLTFTVVRLTIANQMLSLVGSILPEPFAPPQNPDQNAAPMHAPDPEPEAAAEDEDPFAPLGRLADFIDVTTPQKVHKNRKDKDKDGRKKHKHKHRHKMEEE